MFLSFTGCRRVEVVRVYVVVGSTATLIVSSSIGCTVASVATTSRAPGLFLFPIASFVALTAASVFLVATLLLVVVLDFTGGLVRSASCGLLFVLVPFGL